MNSARRPAGETDTSTGENGPFRPSAWHAHDALEGATATPEAGAVDIPRGVCIALRDCSRALARFPGDHRIHRPTATHFAELLKEYARRNGGALDLEILAAGAVAKGEWVYRVEQVGDPITMLAGMGVSGIRLLDSAPVAELTQFLSHLATGEVPAGDPSNDWLAHLGPVLGVQWASGKAWRNEGSPGGWANGAAPLEGPPAGRPGARLPRLTSAARTSRDLRAKITSLQQQSLSIPLAHWVTERACGSPRPPRANPAQRTGRPLGRSSRVKTGDAELLSPTLGAALSRLRDRMVHEFDARGLSWLIDRLESSVNTGLGPLATQSLLQGLREQTSPLWFSGALRALPTARAADLSGLLVRLGPEKIHEILRTPDILQTAGAPTLLRLLLTGPVDPNQAVSRAIPGGPGHRSESSRENGPASREGRESLHRTAQHLLETLEEIDALSGNSKHRSAADAERLAKSRDLAADLAAALEAQLGKANPPMPDPTPPGTPFPEHP